MPWYSKIISRWKIAANPAKAMQFELRTSVIETGKFLTSIVIRDHTEQIDRLRTLVTVLGTSGEKGKTNKHQNQQLLVLYQGVLLTSDIAFDVVLL